MQKHKDPSKAHQIKLDVIVKTLRWLEMDMDVDEVMISSLFSLFGMALTKQTLFLPTKEIG